MCQNYVNFKYDWLKLNVEDYIVVHNASRLTKAEKRTTQHRDYHC